MLDAMKALAERSVLERLVLLANHVIAAEPAAVERLRPHAARSVEIALRNWPSLLPAVGPFSFRITPAGLLERIDPAAATPAVPLAADLRIDIDAANPALALARLMAGERPQVVVSGDAAFASDIDWLLENLRWDVQDDLARIVGVGAAQQIARVFGWIAAGVRDGARVLRDLAAGAPAR